MRMFKKIVALVVMVLSGLLLLGFLGGSIGVWTLRSNLIQTGNDLADLSNSSLQRAATVATTLQAQVAQRQAAVNGALGKVDLAANLVGQTNLVILAAEQLLDTDLTPRVQQMQEQASDLRTAIALADTALNVMLRMPWNRDGRSLQLAGTVIEALKGVDQRVQDLRQVVGATKSRLTSTAQNALTTPLQRVDAALGTVTDGLNQLQCRLAAGRTQIADLYAQFNQIVTWGTIGLTVACLWLALAQAALFVHAYSLFTGRDPLARWRSGRA
jgi:hypothetical protein